MLLTYISVVVAYNKTVWEIGNYPNPVTSPAECGSTESSYLCDPDEFLSPDKGDYTRVSTTQMILRILVFKKI